MDTKETTDASEDAQGQPVAICRSAFDAMLHAAQAAHPLEACGILSGRTGFIASFAETANVHPSARTQFEIDPQALIDAHRAARSGREQLLGYFHSHPGGPARPSPTDIAMAAHDGAIWAIAGYEGRAWTLRLWRDGAAGFDALPYVVDKR